MKIVFTGSAGFLAGYAVQELLNNGHKVIGIDNFSKYGKVEKEYDNHPHYTFIEGDAKDVTLMKKAVEDADILVSAAAVVGGISFIHAFAYDLLAENERITATAFDAAIWANKEKKLKKIVLLSSSMLYERTDQFPTPEDIINTCPPPVSAYGFQKLAVEYFAHAAMEQYQLPYTIVRPFNVVGTGEKRVLNEEKISKGTLKQAVSHVIPDLIHKIINGQDPLHILGNGSQVRHYTYGGDIARGIRLCIEKEEALNQAFNISTPESTTVLQLAEKIWKKLKGDVPFRHVSDKASSQDVQKNIADTRKAKELLGFEAQMSLDQMLDEVIPWMKEQIAHGNI